MSSWEACGGLSSPPSGRPKLSVLALAPTRKPDKAALSSFNTSEQRFKPLVKGMTGKPGPGQYDALDQYSMAADLQRKTHGRNGVFGSTTRRFHTLKQDPVPGAGTYNPAAAGSAKDDKEEVHAIPVS